MISPSPSNCRVLILTFSGIYFKTAILMPGIPGGKNVQRPTQNAVFNDNFQKNSNRYLNPKKGSRPSAQDQIRQ